MPGGKSSVLLPAWRVVLTWSTKFLEPRIFKRGTILTRNILSLSKKIRNRWTTHHRKTARSSRNSRAPLTMRNRLEEPVYSFWNLTESRKPSAIVSIWEPATERYGNTYFLTVHIHLYIERPDLQRRESEVEVRVFYKVGRTIIFVRWVSQECFGGFPRHFSKVVHIWNESTNVRRRKINCSCNVIIFHGHTRFYLFSVIESF